MAAEKTVTLHFDGAEAHSSRWQAEGDAWVEADGHQAAQSGSPEPVASAGLGGGPALTSFEPEPAPAAPVSTPGLGGHTPPEEPTAEPVPEEKPAPE